MDHIQKLKHTIDALFGTGVSKKLPKDIEIKISKKTGRIRSVYHNGILLFTTRTDVLICQILNTIWIGRTNSIPA